MASKDEGIGRAGQRDMKLPGGADCERETLLKAVADCWATSILLKHPSTVAFPYTGDTTNPRRWRNLHLTGNDVMDAPAVILMLDEMERRGHKAELRGSSEWRYDCNVHASWDKPGSWRYWEGKTRAEAVARAFVAVMTAEATQIPANNEATASHQTKESEVTSEEEGEDYNTRRLCERGVDSGRREVMKMMEVKDFRVAIRCEMCGDTRSDTGTRYCSDQCASYWDLATSAAEEESGFEFCPKCNCETKQWVVGYSSEPRP